MSIRHVILDRDGTLIRHIHYLHDPLRVEVLPTVVEGLKKLMEAGCFLYLHTNQSGIGRGYFSLDDAVACNEAMLDRIGMGRDLFKEICIAPESPDQPGKYRKPSPAWGLELMKKARCDKTELCYIGDTANDLLTAKNIGCKGVGVSTGLNDLRSELVAANMETTFPVFDNFLEAARHVA